MHENLCCFAYFLSLFSPFFASWQKFASDSSSCEKQEHRLSHKSKANPKSPHTDTVFLGVWLDLQHIVCVCWREGIAGSGLEWIKSELEIENFSSVMATFYMLRALVCCHLAVMPINLRRKSDKTHFDSAKKPLPQSGDVPLSTHLDAHLFAHAFGFAFWSKND